MTRSAYIKSNHTPARDAVKDQKRYRHRKANGIPARVPTGRVYKHLEALYAAGVTRTSVARAAGVPRNTIDNIEDGVYATCLARVAAAILAVTPSRAVYGPGDLVSSIGARRRVHALNAMGWASDELARQLGLSDRRIAESINKSEITYRRWCEIRDLYDKLSAIPGPSLKARKAATRNGYHAPLDWEYLDIDDPDVTPEPAKATPRHIIEQQKRDRDNQIRAAVEAGRPLDVIAREIGASVDHVRRIGVARNQEAA